MRRLMAMLFPLLLMLSAAAAETTPYYIDGGNADRVHLRAQADREAESLGLYYTGTDVILIDRLGEWAWVMVGDESGYIMSQYLTEEPLLRAGPWYVVDNPYSTWVNLRMSSSMDGFIAMCPDNGNSVRILGETADGWSYVECDGVIGYMVTDYLSSMPEEPLHPTTIVGKTGDWQYIHQYMAPNGQLLYFVSLEEQPHILFDDVNFDGMADIVVTVAQGASNFFAEFFVYDASAGQYVLAEHAGFGNGLPNYALHPAEEIVSTYGHNGSAGAEHEIQLFRWEGTNLRCIREAVSEPVAETIFDGQTFTETIYRDKLQISVWDFQHSEYEGTELWSDTIALEDVEYRDIFTEEQEALWQGLR